MSDRVKECKTCLNAFLCSGHMIHLRRLLTVLIGPIRPLRMKMLHPAATTQYIQVCRK